MQRFEPPDRKGRNVKCIATIKLPPSAGGQLPARTRVCGALFKHVQTNRSAQVSGTGTTGLKNHIQKCHPSEFAMWDEGRASKAVKNERGTILADDVRLAIVAKLKIQIDSAKELGYEGPVFGLQSDMTSSNGIEFCTFSVPFVPEGAMEMERLTLTTKAFSGRHTAEDIAPWIREVINNYFEPILGEGNAHPAKLFIAGTVDQGGNMINAFRLLGIPVLVCSGHRLNSAVGWALGINGSIREDGQGTCRNPVLRDLIAKMTACAAVFSHSPCNTDALADIQRELNDICRALEIVRRNNTRWASQHAMLLRLLRLYKAITSTSCKA
ncbi:unnamed protein product [Pylaiella littoralis]